MCRHRFARSTRRAVHALIWLTQQAKLGQNQCTRRRRQYTHRHRRALFLNQLNRKRTLRPIRIRSRKQNRKGLMEQQLARHPYRKNSRTRSRRHHRRNEKRSHRIAPRFCRRRTHRGYPGTLQRRTRKVSPRRRLLRNFGCQTKISRRHHAKSDQCQYRESIHGPSNRRPKPVLRVFSALNRN